MAHLKQDRPPLAYSPWRRRRRPMPSRPRMPVEQLARAILKFTPKP